MSKACGIDRGPCSAVTVLAEANVGHERLKHYKMAILASVVGRKAPKDKPCCCLLAEDALIEC